MKKSISNSERISENHITGINRVVKLDIVIDGKPISHFKYFRLHQNAKTHHSFELTLAHDSLGEIENHNLEQAKQFFGKRLTVTFKYKDSESESPERTFVGVIMKVAFSQEKMSLGNIVLKGHSPTILMDSAPHTQSFGGSQAVNTSIIADRIIREALGTKDFDFIIETENNSYINYSSQYCETHYNYLARIAETYGEQFYYDGMVLHFGKLPPHEKSIKLIDGSNVSDVQIELNAIHAKPEYFGYNSSSDAKMLGIDNQVKHLGELSSEAYQLNNNLFKTRSLTPAPLNANMFLDIDDSQKSARGSKAVEVFTVSGKTTIPFLYIGCVADLAMGKSDSNQTSHFTTIMMTKVNHEVDARGYYTGSFEAIAEGTGFMPKPDFVMPKAEPQIATVISNVDPLNQGRIQVRFDWQLNDTTHFIRMMSPDAGGTDAINQNRGFVAVPEIGDQVMVGFEYHNPDFPFAMGGMFHGKVGLGGGMDNHLKSIQTRSGIKVLMNDAEKSITIQDPSGNIYFMDGQGNIKVTAPKKIIMNATDIQVNASGSGPDSLFDSYASKIDAADQGIAIRLNKHAESNYGAVYGAEKSADATTGNNFISFWNRDGKMVGRIEGESLKELTEKNGGYLKAVKNVGIAEARRDISLAFRSIEFGIQAYENQKSAASKKTATGLTSPNITGIAFPLPLTAGSKRASAAQLEKSITETNTAFKMGERIANFVLDITQQGISITDQYQALEGLRNSVGVKYSSSAGDYAEYLELMDYNDSKKIIPAQVVGVKGGKISLNTNGCDKIMVVSMSPAVVGKEPSKENRAKFKPVAFMGQVPVFVLNKSSIGDYIVPSGNNDGNAIAKSPNMMKIDDYKNIIGIAWEETNATKVINVVVGINTNDLVGVIKQQQSRITKIEEYLTKNSEAPFGQQTDNDTNKDDKDLALSIIYKGSKINESFHKIIATIAENLKNQNINSLKNKDAYIENEVNNYFSGIFFDKKVNNKLTSEQQKLFTKYFKIIVNLVKMELK